MSIRETVEAPRSPDERRFIAKHVIKRMKHPVQTKAQIDGDTVKDRSRADDDLEAGEDSLVYETVRRDQKRESIVSNIMESRLAQDVVFEGCTSKIGTKDKAVLEKLFKELSPENRKEMQKRSQESQEGLDEILKFAKEFFGG